MDQVVVFHYQYRNSFIHKIDPRIKLLSMFLISIAISILSSLYMYIILTIFIFAILLLSKLPILSIIKNIKMFYLLILFIIAINSINITDGISMPFIPILKISMSGFVYGLYFAWRLILIILLSSVVMGTMSIITLRNVIEWYLRPIPFVEEKNIATMINITFLLIPIIFDKHSEIHNAQISRCIDLRKNPIKKITYKILPLLKSVFIKVDEIVYTMESRCYSEERSRFIFRSKGSDFLIILFCMAILSLVIIF